MISEFVVVYVIFECFLNWIIVFEIIGINKNIKLLGDVYVCILWDVFIRCIIIIRLVNLLRFYVVIL